MIKITFEGTVSRIYDETRGDRTTKYVVVSDGAEKFPNVLRFRMKPNAVPPCKECDKVKVAAYIDGREWTNKEGKTFYFSDFTVDTIEVTAAGNWCATSVSATTKPTTAADWNGLIALGAAYGEDTNAVTSRCKATHPGKASNTYTASDWQAVANVIVAAHTPKTAAPAPDFTSDMPF